MYYQEKDVVTRYYGYLTLNKRFIDDIFAIWAGPGETLTEFL